LKTCGVILGVFLAWASCSSSTTFFLD